MKVDKKLKFTFLIVKREISTKIISMLKTIGIETYFSFYGKGSASIAILDYLGIGETENNIIIIPSGEKEASAIIETVKNSEYLKYIIAFVVPVKGISNLEALNYFLRESENNG